MILLILIITLPTKYGNNPLTNIRFNHPTNLPTILLPTHLPLTSQWDNLAMNINLTNLQVGTNPLADLQFNLPTNFPTIFLHTGHCMSDNLASNKAGLPITPPTPYPSHLPFTPPNSQHISTWLPLMCTNLLLSLSMYVHFSANLPTILPTHLPHTSQWDNIAIKLAGTPILIITNLPTTHTSHLLFSPPIHLYQASTNHLLLPILIRLLESMHSSLEHVTHNMGVLPPSGLLWMLSTMST